MVGCADPVSSTNCKTALSESEEVLDGIVFNKVIKKFELTNEQSLILSARTTQLDSIFHLHRRRKKALFITSRASPDKTIGIKADEICWSLFELVGFLLSDRLTTQNANS